MSNQRSSDRSGENLVERGFTLVELLIVVVILGILAAIVVFAVGNVTSTATSHACATEMNTFETAVQAFKAQNNGSLPGGGAATAATAATALVGANLLASTTLGYNGAGANQWSYATTGAVTAGATCS